MDYKDYQEAFKNVLPDKALDDKIMNYSVSNNESVITIDQVKTSKKRIIYIAAAVAVVAIIAATSIPLYFNNKLNKIQRADISPSSDKNTTAVATDAPATGYTNIALFGVDSRDNSDATSMKDPSRCDTTMLISIDNDKKTINTVSFYRDTYIYIKDYGNDNNTTTDDYTKLCHAYSTGSYDLTVKTLNENYDLNIDKYITVNFNSFVKIADLLGGLTIDVKTSAMVKSINKYGSEAARINNESFTKVTTTGSQNLDGYQLLGYVRTRKIDSDFNRTKRQREVLSMLFDKAKKAGLSKCDDILDIAADNILTNLSNKEMLSLAGNLLNYNMGSSEGFPYNHYSGHIGIISSVFSRTLDADINILHTTLYPDLKYTQSGKSKEISTHIDSIKPLTED